MSLRMRSRLLGALTALALAAPADALRAGEGDVPMVGPVGPRVIYKPGGARRPGADRSGPMQSATEADARPSPASNDHPRFATQPQPPKPDIAVNAPIAAAAPKTAPAASPPPEIALEAPVPPSLPRIPAPAPQPAPVAPAAASNPTLIVPAMLSTPAPTSSGPRKRPGFEELRPRQTADEATHASGAGQSAAAFAEASFSAQMTPERFQAACAASRGAMAGVGSYGICVLN